MFFDDLKDRRKERILIWKKERRKGLCFDDCLKKERKGEFYIDISKEKKGEGNDITLIVKNFTLTVQNKEKKKLLWRISNRKKWRKEECYFYGSKKMKDLVLSFRWKEEKILFWRFWRKEGVVFLWSFERQEGRLERVLTVQKKGRNNFTDGSKERKDGWNVLLTFRKKEKNDFTLKVQKKKKITLMVKN